MSENNLNQYDGGRGGNNGAPGNGNGGAGGTGGPNKDSRRQNIIMFVIEIGRASCRERVSHQV